MGSFVMSTSTLPKNPVENWQQVRDEWVAAVEQLIGETETWAKSQDWGTLRESKTITEDRLGTYTVPRLLVHNMNGRVLIEAYARFVPGANGLVDVFRIPSWDGEMIELTADGWYLLRTDAEGPRELWSEPVFVAAVHRLTMTP